MSDNNEYVVIENVELEFFNDLRVNGDYFTSNFIYPPCSLLNPDTVSTVDTTFHKDSLKVKSKDTRELSITNALDWKTIPIPLRAIVSVKKNTNGTLTAHDVHIVDGDISMIAAMPRRRGTPRPGHPTEEESHEASGFVHYSRGPQNRTPSPSSYR